MKKTIFPLLMLSLLFSACDKSDNLKEILPEKASYSVEDITYSLKESDGTSILTHTPPSIVLTNRTSSLLMVTHYDEDKDYPTTSLFTFEQPLPLEIEDTLLSIKTPAMLIDNKIYSDNKGWILSRFLQTKPYSNSKTPEEINIPANQKVTIIRSFDEEILQASFVLTLRNDVTNEISTYNGKWEGTLDYKNRSIELKQENVE